VQRVALLAPTDLRPLRARYRWPTLLLVTCAPYGVDTAREIIVAQTR
jgi:sortase (surface protein transpeptidase)